jgi:ABC-type branched-subunit amino acid transport system substrate-binding protein
MREMTRWRRTAAILSVVAITAAACGDGGDDTEPPAGDGDGAGEEPGDEGDGDEGDGDAAPAEIAFDTGVTEEPCPEAVNPDNGCIYLGILSDLTEGPFAPLGVQIVEGQRAFWANVNAEGGIGGFDIDVETYTRDNKYDPQEQSAQYRQIEPEILALAQTLGTPPTEAILPDMDADDVIGAPASWWSGWHFPEVDNDLILESGYSYCIEAQIGLDWVNDNVRDIETLIAVGYPGDYGGDFAAGAEAWAEANGIEFVGFVETAPNAVVGSQDAAIGQVVNSGADVVAIATGPAETAEIVGTAAAQGFEGNFLGSVPTWNPALLQSPAAPALEALFIHIAPWENFEGGSAAHQAMQESLDGELPVNDGYTFGWIWSYPLKAALEAAADNGDLTRAGLRSVVDGLVVDFEGAVPETTLGGDANENASRFGVISRPDPETALGLATIETEVTGPTADAYEYTSACSGV